MKIEVKFTITVKGSKLTKEAVESIIQGVSDGIKNDK